MRGWYRVAVLGVATAAACELAEPPVPQGNNVCDAPTVEAALPPLLAETSGVAASRSYDGIFWTHNDSGGDVGVFAIDSTGTIRAAVRVEGASNRDWEDIARGPCEPGADRDCLFIGEIGDNNEHHPHVAVYRIPEPGLSDTVSAPADIFRFTYPGGARDAEGLFATDAGLYIVGKGRSDEIALFRLPPPYRTGTTPVTLERIQRLASPPTSMSAQVSAAAVDTAGRQVVLRTYSGLRFFRFDGDTLRAHGRHADVVAPNQLQGEGVDFMSDGRLVLTSEAQSGRPPALAIATCDPTRPAPDTAGSPTE